MIKKIFTKLFITTALFLAISPVVMQPVYAKGFSNSKSSACAGISQLGAGQNCGSGGTAVDGLIQTGVYILSWVIGIIAVIMVLVSGLKFITAGGESSKVAEAKTALMWALAGVVVVALAQALIHWVFNTSTSIVHNAGGVLLVHIVDFL